jgi:hypothetical protein
MHKFIHSSFELDLSDKEITTDEENHWFTDSFLTVQTYPVDIVITPDIDRALGMISDINSAAPITVLRGYFYMNGDEHEAQMKLDRIERSASFVFTIGLEELPNFDKKLAQLPLLKEDLVDETMAQHATDRLNLEYPDTQYNFPQLHINSLDNSSDQWQYFENRLNARDFGAFLENTFDTATNEQINRNILQPLPALFHVIKAGFEDLNYNVTGSFFDIPAFAKAYIFHFSEYYRSFNSATQELVSDRTQNDGTRYVNPNTGVTTADYNYQESSTPLEPGIYLLNGVLNSYGDQDFVLIMIGTTVVYRGFGFFGYALRTHYVDVTFEVVAGGPNVLNVFAAQANFSVDFDGTSIYDSIWLDLTIAQIARLDANGNLISTLIVPTDVDLTKCVPDITFGDLLSAIKNYIGIDVYQTGPAQFRIDVIKDIIDTLDIIDLSAYEVRYPRRENRKTDKFILKAPESIEGLYTQQSLMITTTGSQAYQGELIDKDTNEVQIDLTILEQRNIDGRRTAQQASDEKSKLNLVRYEGLQGANNYTVEFGLNLQQAYDDYLKEIYEYKINGQPLQWSFIAPEITLRDLKKRSRVFAYNKIHQVEKIQRTNLGRGMVQVRLDVVSLT